MREDSSLVPREPSPNPAVNKDVLFLRCERTVPLGIRLGLTVPEPKWVNHPRNQMNRTRTQMKRLTDSSVPLCHIPNVEEIFGIYNGLDYNIMSVFFTYTRKCV